MRLVSIIFLIFVCFCSYAGDLLADAPKELKEYENFRIKVNNIHQFQITLSSTCLTVSDMEGVIEANGIYSSKSGGVISFDNYCFEGDSVEIDIVTDYGTEKLRYGIKPREIEERSYGC